MSKDTPFNAMMPPNTTLTSRTANRRYWPCASCASVILLRPPAPGPPGHAKWLALPPRPAQDVPRERAVPPQRCRLVDPFDQTSNFPSDFQLFGFSFFG